VQAVAVLMKPMPEALNESGLVIVHKNVKRED